VSRSKSRVPDRRWKLVASAVGRRVKEDQVTLLGAGVAFYGLLSLVPSLIAAVSIYGLVSDPEDVARQVDGVAGALPGPAKELLTDQLSEIVSASGASPRAPPSATSSAHWTSRSASRPVGATSSDGRWPWSSRSGRSCS
jgi:uncharacterized BrkB/YihY/UPF0761 family membrane protein